MSWNEPILYDYKVGFQGDLKVQMTDFLYWNLIGKLSDGIGQYILDRVHLCKMEDYAEESLYDKN